MPTILLNKIRIGGKAPTNIKKGGVDVKYVKKGNTVVYDTLSYYSYGTPVVTLTYPSGNVQQGGGTKAYSNCSWTQTRTAYGHSGASYSASSLSGSGASNFSFTCSPTTYGSVLSTGTFSFNANNTTSTRSVKITATTTQNGKTGSGSATIYQNGMSTYYANIYWPHWSSYQSASWGLFYLPPTMNVYNYQILYSSNTATIAFNPGQGLWVNYGSGTSTGTYATGTIYVYYQTATGGNGYLGSFVHDSSKSYTITFN